MGLFNNKKSFNDWLDIDLIRKQKVKTEDFNKITEYWVRFNKLRDEHYSLNKKWSNYKMSGVEGI